MGLFDNDSSNTLDLNNPTMLALLGALGGLGSASAPSRLPVPGGVAWGSAAQGLLGGLKQGAETQGLGYLNELRKYQAQHAKMQAETLKNLDFSKLFSGDGAAPGGVPSSPAPVLPGQANAPLASLTPRTVPNPGHVNFGGTGALGDPRAPGYEANLTTVKSPSGAGFQVHQSAATDVANFLKELEDTGYKIDPKTSGGYNLRDMTNKPGTLSEHGYGTAFDINSKRNPYSAAGIKITDLPENVAEIAARHNLEWGGNWAKPSDPMHFQWRGPQIAQAPGGVATDASAGPPPLSAPPGDAAARLNPVELAKLRAGMAVSGVPGDPLAGFEKLYYNSPQYLAAAEAARAGAKGQVDIATAGPIAKAQAEGKLPSDAVLKQIEADFQRRNQAFQAGMVPTPTGVAAVPNFKDIQADQAAEKVRREEEARAGVKFGPGATALPGVQAPAAAPGQPVPFAAARGNPALAQDNPVQTDRGTFIPPLSTQPKIEGTAQIERTLARREEWEKTTGDKAAQATNLEARLLAVAQAMREFKTGKFMSNAAEWSTRFEALGLPVWKGADDVQSVIQSNIIAAGEQLRALDPRYTQAEVETLQKALLSPDLEPETNYRTIVGAVTNLRRQQQVYSDWVDGTHLGMLDPHAFQRSWDAKNPHAQTKAEVMKEIAPLKGMPGAAAEQPAQVGKSVVAPVSPPKVHQNPQTGQRIIFDPKLGWVDEVTRKPVR